MGFIFIRIFVRMGVPSIKRLLASLFLLIPLLPCAQKLEGAPFIRNYSPKEYKNSPDNWAIAQDRRGVMYFGNASSVLEYDGNKWRSISVSNNSLVRSIAIDSNGFIYIGAVGEIGFLEPDGKGAMVYHSLVDKLPMDERQFADVWKTYATPEGVYFQTFSKLIRIHKGVVKIWKPQTTFHFSFYCDGKLYINEREKGLKCLLNEKLESVKGGEVFSSMRIYGLLPSGNDQLLLATREKGLYLFDKKNSTFSLLPAEVNQHLINDQVYGAISIGKGLYAFATLKNGVFITDVNGTIKLSLNKASGLQDDIVKYLSQDNQGDLWIALGTGISRAEISSPLSTLNDAQGLAGFVQDIVRLGDELYVATSLGVFVSSGDHFIPVKGINSQTWSLEKFVYGKDSIILASSDVGVFILKKDQSNLLKQGVGYFVSQSKMKPERFFVAMNDGLVSMRLENGRWIDEDYINGIENEIRSLAEDKNGDLWLGTPFDGLIRLSFNVKPDTLITAWNVPFKISYYDTLSGLPNQKYNIPYRFGDNIVFATISGVYEFEQKSSKFVVSSFLQKELSKSQVYRLAAKDISEVWLFTVASDATRETGIASLAKDNSYVWYSRPFLKIADREIHALFPDRNNITWLGGPDGLLHYDAAVKKDFYRPFHALIRMVTLSDGDSIFCGSFYETNGDGRVTVASQAEFMKPIIEYKNNALLFEYSATSYGDEKNNMYSVYLEGKDTAWSKWTDKAIKEYTNLNEGTYTFHIKARNIYGTESIEASYEFKILPPWYRTAWAYVIYVVSFIGFVYLIIRLSIRRLVKAKIKLEGIVKERTAEVVQQKHLVEEKQKEIIDSINYAQRIQRALLAGEKLLKTNVPQHFVFFQPKDIVSGDFYWGAELPGNRFALVTADSTGHGVPGAIMSMLNISCLNDAVVGQKLSEPDQILNSARSRIIQHLANDGSAEGGKDGMDCSLLCFDLKNSKMSYAAANNPLWIVRKKEIIEYNPDKMPVGKHDHDSVSFTKHEVELQKGDMIFTSTDGMPDQFGGPKGKKFMYKKLKELFIEISELALEEQKERLRSAINNWKGDLEQVDDVCIIGVRI